MSNPETPIPGRLGEPDRNRAKAGFHAREAARLLTSDNSYHDAALATAHALTSLAFTQISPPARRRPPRHDGGKPFGHHVDEALRVANETPGTVTEMRFACKEPHCVLWEHDAETRHRYEDGR